MLHGLGTGSDTDTPWMTAIYGGSAALVLGATAWRVARTPQARAALFTVSAVALIVVASRV